MDFRLDDVIASVTAITSEKAQEKGLEFLTEVDGAVPQPLVGDPLRLGQVIANLINNAIKFTERGEVYLKAELQEQVGERARLRFSVSDTGIGMTPEQAARLFQPFTQADASTTRKHGGTGLGLTISRRLVELMGGEIGLDSEPGAGSTFHFTVSVGVASGAARDRVVPEPLRAVSALVVDDNAAARDILVHAPRERLCPGGCGELGRGSHRRREAARHGPAVRRHLHGLAHARPGWDRGGASHQAGPRPDDAPGGAAGHRVRARGSTGRGRARTAGWGPDETSHGVHGGRYAGRPLRRDPARPHGTALGSGPRCGPAAGHTRAAGRRQRDQPADCRGVAGGRGRNGRSGERRPGGGPQATGAARVSERRRGADGRANAGDGWLPGDEGDPVGPALRGSSDHRHDGPRHHRGTAEVSGRGHERSRVETDRSRGALRDRGALRRREGARSRRAGCGAGPRCGLRRGRAAGGAWTRRG